MLGTVFSEVVASFHVAGRKLPHVIKVNNSRYHIIINCHLMHLNLTVCSTYIITPLVVRSILEHVIDTTRPSTITLPLHTTDVPPTLEFPPQSSILGEVWESPDESIQFI